MIPEHHAILIEVPGITWTRKEDPETGILVAICQPLKLAAWGSTEDDLADCKGKVMTLFLSYLADQDILESFMEEHGFPVRVCSITPLPHRKHLAAKPNKARRKARAQRATKADRQPVYVRSSEHAYV